jgi:preprotein translocase subunit SecF
VLVGTYTSVFIASPILIYLGVGTGRQNAPDTPEKEPATEAPPARAGAPAVAARVRR